MRIDTWEQFEEAILKLGRKYNIASEELNQLVEDKKTELSRVFDGEVLPANLFNSVKAAVVRRNLGSGGRPHLVCIISDSGAFNYVNKQYREAYRQFRQDPEGAIQAGLVAGTRHPEVLAGRARVGDPIGSDGRIHRVRRMRMMRVVVAPLVEDSAEADIHVCQATLWDEDADNFEAEYFKWFVVNGTISSDGEWFNFRSIDKQPVPPQMANKLPPAYDFVVDNNIIQRVRLSELFSYYNTAPRRYIEAIDTDETIESIVIEATVVDMRLDNVRQYGDRSFYSFILDDALDPDSDDRLRVNVPTFMKIDFALDSRIAVVGKIRKISDEYGGGWQIWQCEAIYPIPGMYIPRSEPGTPGMGTGSSEAEVGGITTPSEPQHEVPEQQPEQKTTVKKIRW